MLLKRAGLFGLSFPWMPFKFFERPTPRGLVSDENRKPGTTDWQLTFIRSEGCRSDSVEGYCSKTSVRAGEAIEFYLSAESACEVSIDIYRMGYYGGKGGRLMNRLGPFSVSPQGVPFVAEHRLRQCEWHPATSFTIPKDWISGVYIGKLSCSTERYQSYVIFIVRDDRNADVMFQCSDNTWQAYNKWPADYSLYDSDSPDQPLSSRTWVSFERPYGKYPQVVDQPLSQGSGEFLLWEFPLCYWLEQHGYDVTYCSNIDTHSDKQGLERVKCFLSVGHDEYWTLRMFDNVKQAVQNGVSVAFLSGNSIMWGIGLEPRIDFAAIDVDKRTGLTQNGSRVPTASFVREKPHRTIYRMGRFGGVSQQERATGMMGPFTGEWPNENTLIGARTMYPFNGSADWIISNPDHWIFQGTGVKKGDRIPGLVGWEHHGDPANIHGLEVIAEGSTINSSGEKSNYTATVYPGPKGNWVFNAATIFWSMGLSQPPGHIVPYVHFGHPHGVDERVQMISENFLKKCGIRRG
jgi:hypothetical protein